MIQKISIIICLRKKSNNLIKCLKSIKYFGLENKVNLILIENNLKKTLNKKEINDLKFNKNFKIFYHLEKKRGIPHARNKGLKILNKTKSDFVCFFDDDCEISKNWLKYMMKAHNNLKINILTGPQISKSRNIFLKILERKNKNYKRVKWAATNNVFAKTKVILNSKLKFSEKLNNIGGSDQLFFLKMNKLGNEILWNRNAIVYEQANFKRDDFWWFVKRNLRYGTSSGLIYRELHGISTSILLSMSKSIYEFFKFLFYLLNIFFNFKINFYKSIQYLIRSIATFVGIFGIRFNEYK